MGWFPAIDVSASGLYAQRAKLNVIAENVANVKTTRTSEGVPYRRQDVVFTALLSKAEQSSHIKGKGLWCTHSAHICNGRAVASSHNPGGVESEIVKDFIAPFKRIYDPSHPDADLNGYVKLPNVDLVQELVDMAIARRAYEANISVIEAAKSIASRSLEIGR